MKLLEPIKCPRCEEPIIRLPNGAPDCACYDAGNPFQKRITGARWQKKPGKLVKRT